MICQAESTKVFMNPSRQRCKAFVSVINCSIFCTWLIDIFILFQTKVSKGKKEKAFYNIPEFEEWKNSTENAKSWNVKYYRKLLINTPEEFRQYFRNITRHCIQFCYESPVCDEAIEMVGTSKTKLRMDERLMIISHMSYLYMVFYLWTDTITNT